MYAKYIHGIHMTHTYTRTYTRARARTRTHMRTHTQISHIARNFVGNMRRNYQGK